MLRRLRDVYRLGVYTYVNSCAMSLSESSFVGPRGGSDNGQPHIPLGRFSHTSIHRVDAAIWEQSLDYRHAEKETWNLIFINIDFVDGKTSNCNNIAAAIGNVRHMFLSAMSPALKKYNLFLSGILWVLDKFYSHAVCYIIAKVFFLCIFTFSFFFVQG